MKKTIVVSAINFTSGGPLSILKESLAELSQNFAADYRVIALVNSKELLSFDSIELIAFPYSKKSWLIRMYYEYIYFYFLSIKLKPDFWVSLHDMSPNVKCKNRFVYCHNPSPFYESKKTDWYKNTKAFLFSKFYKYLYGINIKKNTYVIVQQSWLRDYFISNWSLSNVIVAYPHVVINSLDKDQYQIGVDTSNKPLEFFYPSFPRPFKNFEIICEAYSLMSEDYQKQIKIYLTLNEELNTYATEIVNKYKHLPGIVFLGLLSRDEVENYYTKADCLIFPSKLETWGLPITEFKSTGKPILLANLPYAKETLGDYDKVSFFDVNNPEDLKLKMIGILENQPIFVNNHKIDVKQPFTEGWPQLFNLILENAN